MKILDMWGREKDKAMISKVEESNEQGAHHLPRTIRVCLSAAIVDELAITT